MPASRSHPKHRTGGPARAGSVRRRGRHVSSYGDGFGRFAGITTLALLPGAGLVAVGRRRLGLLLLLATGLAVAVLAAVALSGNVVERVLTVAVSPDRLLALAALAVVVGLVWCATIVVTAWRARPERPSPFQGLVGTVLVAALCLAVAAPSAKGAQLAMVQRDLVTTVFGDSTAQQAGVARPKAKGDPWKGVPRVNLLLLGSDAGADRTGVRTDSMMVVSINTTTGDAVLIGLPRSLQHAPFPASNPLHAVWPDGFNCGSDCLLNAVWDQAAVQHPELFPGDKNPGLTTTRGVISEILGVRLDAYAIIDLRGFQSLVNAMGGVDVNVPRDIPIGGGHNLRTGAELPITGYIRAGHRHLTGYEALWFSRSRSGSDDYDRMRRQRCMVGNLVDQVNPVRLLGKYSQLASVFKNNITTDIPQSQLQAWTVLVQRMQKGKITSLPLTNKVISTVDPDFDQIREYVKRSLDPPPPTPAKASTGTATPSTTRTSSSTPTTPSTPADSSTAQDVSAVC